MYICIYTNISLSLSLSLFLSFSLLGTNVHEAFLQIATDVKDKLLLQNPIMISGRVELGRESVVEKRACLC